jgi:hypothetical protein
MTEEFKISSREILNYCDDNCENSCAQDKLIASYSQIIRYIANADTTTLDLYGLNNRQQDELLACDLFLYKVGFGADPLSFAFLKEKKKVGLRYNDNLGLCKISTIQKGLGHEVGHFYQDGSSDYLTRVNSFPRYRAFTDLANKFPSIAMALEGIGLTELHCPPLITLPVMAVTACAINYPSRVAEFDADLFADKLVPEMTYKEMIYDLLSALDKSKPDISGRFLEIQKYFAIFLSHPSEFSRSARSEKNCDYFLNYKKENNIPSLVNL